MTLPAIEDADLELAEGKFQVRLVAMRRAVAGAWLLISCAGEAHRAPPSPTAVVDSSDSPASDGGRASDTGEARRPVVALWQDCDEHVRCETGSYCLRHPGSSVQICRRGDYQDPCERDAQCMDGNCVVQADSSVGVCTRGLRGDECVDDGDCTEGRCVSRGSAFAPACAAGALGDPCESEVDCDSSLCVMLGTETGRCSEGEIGAFCARAEDCAGGRCALPFPGIPGVCTDGRPDSPCGSDEDCDFGRCNLSMMFLPGYCE